MAIKIISKLRTSQKLKGDIYSEMKWIYLAHIFVFYLRA